MQPDLQQLPARIEFYLCLSAAFRAPMEEDDFHALSVLLPDDLDSILPLAGYSAMEAKVAGLIDAIRQPDCNQLNVLKAYSRMFYTPPIPHSLNAGVYLDNSLMGTYAMEITAMYAQQGLVLSEHERELSDHLCIQLEFVAWLLAGAVEYQQQNQPQQADEKFAALRNFIGRYMAPWIQQLAVGLEAHGDDVPFSRIYQSLAVLATTALQAELAWLNECYPHLVEVVGEKDKKPALQVANVGSPEAMREIIARLHAAGLDSSHLHPA